jgi:ADP-ribose pyrophosphatase
MTLSPDPAPPDTGDVPRPVGPRDVVYAGKIIRVVRQRMRLPSGEIQTWEQAERSPGVRVVVLNGDGVLLTCEWRHEQQRYDYRLPGGKIFDSYDEFDLCRDDPEALARACRRAAERELREEAHLRIDAAAFKPVHVSVCGATVNWDLHYFAAEIDASHSTPWRTTHEGERLRCEFHSPGAVLELFKSGAIGEDRSAALLLRLILTDRLRSQAL